MVQYTTPELVFVISDENVNLNNAENVYVTLQKSNINLTVTGDDLTIEDGKTIKVRLTQQQSQKFDTGSVQVQINWTYYGDNGTLQRSATGVKTIDITKNLLSKVVG